MVGLKSVIRWQGAPPEGSQAPSSSHPDPCPCPPPSSRWLWEGREGHHTGLGESLPHTGDSTEQGLENLLWAQCWETKMFMQGTALREHTTECRSQDWCFALLYLTPAQKRTNVFNCTGPAFCAKCSKEALPDQDPLGSWAWRVWMQVEHVGGRNQHRAW